jgi:hypothetical protein
MLLLAEVPGGRRDRVLIFLCLAFSAVSVPSVDRAVKKWFDRIQISATPAPALGTGWELQCTWY